MKINFYLTESKTELKPIKMFVSLQGRVKVHTNQFVNPKHWDGKKQKVKESVTGAKAINKILQAYEKSAKKVYRKIIDSQERPTAAKIKMLIKPTGRKQGILQLFQEWIEAKKVETSRITKAHISPATIKKYKNTLDHLTAFEEFTSYELTPQTLNSDFYKKFKLYILDEVKNDINTFSDKIKDVKTFCRWLRKEKKISGISDDYEDFERFHDDENDAIPFTKEELLQWHNAKFDEEHMEKGRLIMLFLCSNAMRVSDYNRWEDSWIEEDIIRYRSQKTRGLCIVPFVDDHYFRPVEIHGQLKEKFGSLPRISGDKLNETLEKIGKKLKQTRFKPTSKTGRKTFATRKLLFGVKPEVIMKSTGHKTRKAFDAYVGININDILEMHRESAVNLKEDKPEKL